MYPDRAGQRQKENIDLEPEQSQQNMRIPYVIGARISFGNRILLSHDSGHFTPRINGGPRLIGLIICQ
jgi:hypothetical protein